MLRRRTVLICTGMKWLCLATMLVMFGLIVFLAIDRDWIASTVRSYDATVEVLPAGIRFWFLWLVVSAPVFIWVLILLNLYRLFAGFAVQAVFAPSTIAHLRRIGMWLTVLAPTVFAVRSLVTLILTWANGPGERSLSISFNNQDFLILIFGVVMLVMASVMDEALRLDEENRQIV